MANTFTPDKLHQHFILYAKGWYKRSGDSVDDLKLFMSNWSGTPVTFYRDDHIFELVKDAFIDCCPKWEMKNVLKRLFSGGQFGLNQTANTITLRQLTDTMLAGLANLRVVSDDGMALLTLCSPDFRYLPEPEMEEKG